MPPSATSAAASNSSISVPLVRPDSPPSLSCTASRLFRSGSLSAMMAFCASRAELRPARLSRMMPPRVCVSWYSFDKAIKRSRICGSRVPGRPICELPSSSALLRSLKAFKSLPSRNTASGLTPSPVRNSLADLPIRCVSMTSWPSADTSTGLLSRCSLSDRIASDASSSSNDCRLMARSDRPTSVSAFCCASTMPAFFSARSTSGTTASSASCAPDGAAGTGPWPVFRLRTLLARTSTLSFTSGNADVLPINACDTDLASRCDCISACPVAATSSEPRLADTNE